jgi:fucose 4-O-acetylase-like acetyltransferase
MHEVDIPTNRNFLFDNLKFILILLVVTGHIYGFYIKQSALLNALVIGIYSFHMPAFVFISGFFSKPKNSNTSYRAFADFLIPYGFFVFLWYFNEFIHAGSSVFSVFNPPFHLWYLLSLFFWRVSLPYFRLIKYPIIISIIISLLAGCSSYVGHEFALSRTLSLFPFFVLGSLCTVKDINILHKKIYLAPIGLLAVGLVIWSVLNFSSVNYNFFMG